MLNTMQGKDTLGAALKIYEAGFDLASNYSDPDAILTKKLKFKIYKLS